MKIGGKILPIYSKFSRLARRMANKLRSRCDSVLFDLYASSTGWHGTLLLWLVSKVRLLMVLFLDGLRGKAQLWEGLEIDSGHPLRVLYLADRRSYKLLSPEYLKSILFQPDTVQTTRLESFFMPRVRSIASKQAEHADLVIVEANKLLQFQPENDGKNRWWMVPPLVHMVMDFHPGQRWEEIEEGMHSQRKNLKLVDRCHCRFEISQSEKDFDLFYERMHVPLVTERFRASAQVDSKNELRKVFHKGILMLITQEGQPIAGAINYLHGRNMFGIGLGVLDGEKRWYSLGAMTLLYYHSIRWCYENGIRRLNFGGNRPFQKDGLYDYKQRWGFKPCYDPWMERDWLFWVPNESPAALGWLEIHPFLLPIASSEGIPDKDSVVKRQKIAQS